MPVRSLMAPDFWQEPFRELENLWERMGQVFDPGWGMISGRGMPRTAGWQPMVDVEETEDAYVFEVDLPGVKRDDVTVEVRDQELWITGEIKEKDRAGLMRRKTRRAGTFSFAAALPSGVNPDKVDAKLEDGVLSVQVGKAKESKPRKIEVK